MEIIIEKERRLSRAFMRVEPNHLIVFIGIKNPSCDEFENSIWFPSIYDLIRNVRYLDSLPAFTNIHVFTEDCLESNVKYLEKLKAILCTWKTYLYFNNIPRERNRVQF